MHEVESLRQRLEDAEQALRALRSGEVDAVLVQSGRDQVFTLESFDKPYRLLVEEIASGAATLTHDGEIIHANGALCELLGAPPTVLVGRRLSEFVTPASREQLDELLLAGRTGSAEGRLGVVRADGTCAWREVGVRSKHEGAFGSCLVVTDLTEHKHYRELKRTQERLRTTSERLELAQQVGRIGSYDWNLQSGEVSWSVTMEEQYGLVPGSFAGYDDWKRFVHPEDIARVEARVRQAIESRSEIVEEYRITRADGQTRWLAVRARVFCDEAGKPHRLVGVSTDITEQKRAQAERERLLALERSARAEAERAVRIRDEVLAFVAHDLRNPLVAIEMSASTLTNCTTEGNRQDCLRVIQRCTSEMRRLIGDLLDAARMESGHFSVQPAPADVGAVLREACHVFAHRAAGRNARVECEVPADIPPAAADRDRIAQLVSNLLDNALRYTPAGESIRVTAREVGRFVEVSVADRGPGLRSDDLRRLFDAFWKASPATGPGAGLGLAICKGIVEAHGGTITAESDGSRGTTIRFTLPVAAR